MVCWCSSFGIQYQFGRIGEYHGKFILDMFGHGKPVARRSFLTEFSFRYPPWNEQKFLFMRRLYVYDYFGLTLTWLGLKK